METRPAKKICIRKFRRSWLDENIFKGWLAENDNKAWCKICNISLKCSRYNLSRHAESASHIDNVNSVNVEIDTSVEETELSHSDEVKRVKIKLSAFFAEHNIAFCTVDHLIPLLKNICVRSKAVQDVTLSRTKCTRIVKNVIAKISKFSVLIDKSTDISDTKLLCILVKYVSPVNKKVVTQLFALLPLDASNCSADNLYKVFKKYFAFYEHELHRATYPDVYLVEKVLRRKGDKVYVKWLGFDGSHNSWIHKNNVV
ncbi:hypothetical protein ALC60_09309 [Trachymyrmex zeteki]|uniref:Chromo domain-containing protein n=1 Tax=Mycetomoellerius zeteki TaxID=64791 RepID=A0A151WUT3_9HYME|nr:hypothetical protein ALC60_09309 [Trachymyrmex zeteki]